MGAMDRSGSCAVTCAVDPRSIQGAQHVHLADKAEAFYTFSPSIANILVACGYMALIADFGEHEHVFSPVSSSFPSPSRQPWHFTWIDNRTSPTVKLTEQLRRQFRSFTTDLVTLSPAERSVLGLDAPDRPDQAAEAALTLEGSLRNPTKRPA